MKKVLTCVGTRPNFIKITQLEKHFSKYSSVKYKLLHTGQHFDDNMSNVFFKELNIKPPDVYLDINQGTQLNIIANIMIEMEKYLQTFKPDLVIVAGDVNSSFACAFAADRLGIPVAHIESGLRSFDKSMPEEINRIMIDDIASLFFVTEQSGIDNLLAENKNKENIHFVGNTMIDTLISFIPFIDSSDIIQNLITINGDKIQNFNKPIAAMTFHRPPNVDEKDNLTRLISTIIKLSEYFTVVFPVHPRSRINIEKFGLNIKIKGNKSIFFTEPLGYFDFLKLVKESKLVITDSGGIQEETTFLKIPCLTVRTSTERPVTISEGTNTLVELKEELIIEHALKIINGKYKSGKVPALWDGKATERIVDIVARFLSVSS